VDVALGSRELGEEGECAILDRVRTQVRITLRRATVAQTLSAEQG
jgi:hypothetical protein